MNENEAILLLRKGKVGEKIILTNKNGKSANVIARNSADWKSLMLIFLFLKLFFALQALLLMLMLLRLDKISFKNISFIILRKIVYKIWKNARAGIRTRVTSFLLCDFRWVMRRSRPPEQEGKDCERKPLRFLSLATTYINHYTTHALIFELSNIYKD